MKMKTLEDFLREHGKPVTLKDRIIYDFNKAKKAVRNGVKWAVENPQEAGIYAALITGVAATTRKGFKMVNRYVTARRETYNKERFVYDHSAGRYFKTRKVLNSNDVNKINALRKANPGMKMWEAMERLNLLD